MAGKIGRSGRKPNRAIRLQREFIDSKEHEAEWALALFVETMHGLRNPTDKQLVAAREVMDRIWGKPKQQAIILDWRLTIVQLLRDGRLPPALVEAELGREVAIGLLTAAGIATGESAEANTVSQPIVIDG